MAETNECWSCISGKCVTGPHCVTLGRDSVPCAFARCQDQTAHCNGACHGLMPDGVSPLVGPAILKQLHKFLNEAAGEGLVLDGVDAADLYNEVFG